MKKTFILLSTFLFLSPAVFSQDAKDNTSEEAKVWTLKGNTGLNLSQTSLTNWSAGGDNSVSGNAYLNGDLIYSKDKWEWVNNLILEYGLTNTKVNGTQKSADRIEFSTKLGFKASDKWFYTALGDFKSQFAKGYNYPNKEDFISKFMAPAFSNVALGMDYKPNERFSVFLSPASGKFTFVQDDSLSAKGAFGVDPGDKFKAEFGAYVKAQGEQTIMENVTAKSDVSFFTAYDKSFGNIDIEWNLLISMKINKYLNASINTSLKYDDDIKYVDTKGNTRGPRVQFKEILGVGIGVTF